MQGQALYFSLPDLQKMADLGYAFGWTVLDKLVQDKGFASVSLNGNSHAANAAFLAEMEGSSCAALRQAFSDSYVHSSRKANGRTYRSFDFGCNTYMDDRWPKRENPLGPCGLPPAEALLRSFNYEPGVPQTHAMDLIRHPSVPIAVTTDFMVTILKFSAVESTVGYTGKMNAVLQSSKADALCANPEGRVLRAYFGKVNAYAKDICADMLVDEMFDGKKGGTAPYGLFVVQLSAAPQADSAMERLSEASGKFTRSAHRALCP